MSQVEPLARFEHPGAASWRDRLEDPFVRMYVAAGVTLAAYVPMLIIHFLRLEQNGHYGFYPLIPLGAAALVWQRWPEVRRLSPGRSEITFPVVVGALALHVLAVVMYSPYIATVSFLILVLAVMYGVGGPSFVRKLLPAWAFLWLMVPLPFRMDYRLVQSLQRTTAEWSSRMLDWWGVLHVMSGNAVVLPGRQLLIEEACSGIQSLFACLAFTFFYVFWFRHSIIRGTMVVISAVAWVIVANALRVVAITMLSQRGYASFADPDSWMHLGLGVAMFIFTMSMIVSTDQLLKFFATGFNLERGRSHDRARRDEAPLIPLTKTWFASWTVLPVLALYGLLALAQVYLLWPRSAATSPENVTANWIAVMKKLNEESLPPRINEWTRVGFTQESRPTVDAQYSVVWKYQKGGKAMFLSIDSSFDAWHDLFVCYRGLGWMVSDVQAHPASADEKLPRTEGRLEQSGFRHGYLMWHFYDLYGRPIEELANSLWGRFAARVHNMTAAWQQRTDVTPYLQVQVFMDGFSPATDADLADMREAMQVLIAGTKKYLTRELPPSAAAR